MKQMRSNVSVEFNRGDLKSSISSKETASKKSLNIPPLDPRIFRLAGSNKKVQRKKPQPRSQEFSAISKVTSSV